jgi:hypothetical protein
MKASIGKVAKVSEIRDTAENTALIVIALSELIATPASD